jgi:hypothetical protein
MSQLVAARGLALAVVMVVDLVACGFSGTPPVDEAANRAEAHRVQTVVARLSGVTSAEAAYVNNLELQGDVEVYLLATDDADFDRILDQSARAVWVSRIHPLGAVFVSVSDGRSPGRHLERSYVLPDDRKVLEAAYGKRPVNG